MKIDERIPREVGKGALPDHPAVKTPWEKLVSFHDAYHFVLRNNAAFGAVFTEVLRILIPDYAERAKRMCEINYDIFYGIMAGPYGKIIIEKDNAHPFMAGAFLSGLSSDSGDEALLMYGRVNDFGTNRIEKELDYCPFEIQGSEVCRVSAYITEGNGAGFADARGGPKMEYNMMEARGCGDLHCRFVIENREKYPLPGAKPKESWEVFGPIATEDHIKVTPEEKMLKEPQHFREECDYTYTNGLYSQRTAAEMYRDTGMPSFLLGINYVVPVLDQMLANGEVTLEQLNNIIEGLCSAAGKMMFADFFAKKGLRDWLGAPPEVNDGRLLGAYIELLLQMWLGEYSIVAFNKDEVIYDIQKFGGEQHKSPHVVKGYVALWYGMAKTLIGNQWAAWRETEGVPEHVVRIKIAKKIDKFCR
ncbi:MAG: hypothetical protein LBH51_09715 [Treponema sp.]|jgi:hypothetical protein|nr:hypothetical protein [Treponema sp.]